MAKDLWLPKGYELTDGSKIRSLLFSGEDWQIFDTSGSNNILLARAELVCKWTDTGFLDESLLGEVTFGTASFRSLSSPKKYALSPVESSKSPDSKVDALAFSIALKESRNLSKDVSFHDAIYVEQYSRLLPTWTLTPHVEDEVVLGTWLTGGVVISTDSFRRLTNLTGWMPAGDLVEIVKAAGFHVPAGAGLLTKRKPASRSETDKKPLLLMLALSPKNLKRRQTRLSPKCSVYRDGRNLKNFSTNTSLISSLIPRNTRRWASNFHQPLFCMALLAAVRLSLWRGLLNLSIGPVIR